MKLNAMLPFYEAFRLIQTEPCHYMRLPHWKEDVEIHVQLPDEHSKMTHPYLYVKSRFGMVPWIPTQVEMFSTEWEVHTEPFTVDESDDMDDAFNLD